MLELAEKEEEERGKEEEVKSPEDERKVKLQEIAEQQYGEDGLPIPKPKYPRPLPPLPKAECKSVPETPAEMCGEGPNKKAYFVTYGPTDPWIELPNVTPQQIVAGRQINKYFTGNLDQEVTSTLKLL